MKLYGVTADAEAQPADHMACADEINWNMRQWAVAQAKAGKKAYTYFFTRIPTINGGPSPQGATHTAEISYAWNNPKGQANQTWNDVDTKLADQMSSYWVNFITKGDPNGNGLPTLARVQGPDGRAGDGARRHGAGRSGRADGEAVVLPGRLPAAVEDDGHELSVRGRATSSTRLLAGGGVWTPHAAPCVVTPARCALINVIDVFVVFGSNPCWQYISTQYFSSTSPS